MIIFFQIALTLIVIFTFSFGLWCEVFRYLDFLEIRYTKQTKKRTLWLISSVLAYLIGLLYVVYSVLLR
ncbi:hypothetical protein DB44_AA00010 [Candidatus Protochlamydia amoebophila]|uniref:Uncharacterized protein n=1 Tax=Candidatus Protochlamydia amoebophila TaxID=362787 RepID=A0A0C1K6F7_9BACT|nr:hypothetical protein DB44_AA00010 [Candidatus Protochlamydia amoebophila]